MGGGLLGAVATISTIRYWAAGFAGGGDSGFAALEGLTRTVGAALFLAIWPWLFDTAVSLTNLFTNSLLGSGAVVHSVSHLLAAGLGAGIALNFTPIGLFLDIAIAVAASLLFLGLLLVKIVVSISTVLVFVGMPLAVVAWPVVPWIARAAMRAFAVCLLVPVMWALCFAASAAVSLNAISFNASSVLNALLEPLVAIVLLWVMLRLPIHLAKVAMLGAAPLGGGFASRAVSYAAGSQLRDTARQHLPGWAGGQPTSSNEQPAQAESRTGTRLRQAATLAGASATGGATGAAAAAAGGGASTGTVAGGSAGSTATGPGARRERALVHAAADGAGQRRRTRRPRRAADSELSRAGLRQRDVRGKVPRAHQPRVRRAGHGRRSRPCRPTRSAGSASWSQSTAPERASISPTRRWANGHPTSAKRCARSPLPAPRSAPRRSATRPRRAITRMAGRPWASRIRMRQASSSEAPRRLGPPRRRRHRSRRAPAARASHEPVDLPDPSGPPPYGHEG